VCVVHSNISKYSLSEDGVTPVMKCLSLLVSFFSSHVTFFDSSFDEFTRQGFVGLRYSLAVISRRTFWLGEHVWDVGVGEDMMGS